MAPDDTSGARPAGPVVLRIKLRYDDLDTMVQRFASNVGKSGLFLPTKSIQPIGTEVKFELRLANDTPVLVGLGRVKHVKPPDPAQPKAAFGMAIELMRVSREGREVIIKMIERRRAMGLPDVSIPVPEDVDAAKRAEIESQPRADTSGIVKEAMRDFASAPVAEQVLAPSGPVKIESGPVAVAKTPKAEPAESAKPAAQPDAAKPEPAPAPAPAPIARESAPTFTAPRAGSGAIPAVATDTASGRRSVPVLAPEPARAKRPRATDLLAKANELAERLANVDVPGLDAQVDVDRALMRARALAGSDLDGELAALRESTAAPLAEISVEAASAELARQLGGAAIHKRDRSKKWDAPPPVVQARSADVPVAKAPVVDEAKAPVVEEPVVEAKRAVEEPVVEAKPEEPVVEAKTPAVDEPVVEEAKSPAVEDETPAVVVPEPGAENTRPADPIIAAPAAEALADEADDDDDATRAGDDEPDAASEYAVDEKTRIPTGDDLDGAFLPSASTTTAIDPEDALEVPVEPIQIAAARSPLISDGADEAMLRRALEGSSPSLQLDESDLEEVDEDRGEATHIGSFPIDAGLLGTAMPHAPADLSDLVDRQLAEAEAEADAEFREMQQASGQAPYTIQAYDAEPYTEGEQEVAAEGGEVSDLDVLAEADAGDADLMNAHGERELSQGHAVAYREPQYDDEPQVYGEAPPQYAEQPAYAEGQYAEQPYAEPAEQPQYGDQYGGQPQYSEQPEYGENYNEASRAFAEQVPHGYEQPGEQAHYEQPYAEQPPAYAAPEPVFPDELPGFQEPPARPSQEDFAARLDLDDEPDEDEKRNFPTANPRPRTRPPSAGGFHDPPSESYTFAEPFPTSSNLTFAPHATGEDFDEPHGFNQNTPVPPSRSRPSSRVPEFEQSARPHVASNVAPTGNTLDRALESFDESSNPAATARPESEDLEDALAALDVDLEPHVQEQRRARRKSAQPQRPLPGLPLERPVTGPSPTVARTPTGASATVKPTRTTGANVIQRPPKQGTAPPPIPVAARRPATTPPPVPAHVPPKRASTDDGILIDFDDDD